MASGDTLPYRLTELPEFLPDPLCDTERRRLVKTNKRKGYGVALLSRLLSATDALQHVTVPLWHGPASELYDHAANHRARKVAAAVVGNAAAWSKLERSRDGYLHLHLMASADAPLLLPPGSTRGHVYDAEGLMRYLSKPSDARACRVPVKDERTGKTITTLAPDPIGLLDAVNDYLQARWNAGGRRLPRTSWTLHLPLMRADPTLSVAASG